MIAILRKIQETLPAKAGSAFPDYASFSVVIPEIHCDDPKRCDVAEFMRRHPEYVPYTGQDLALEEQRKRLEVVGRMDGTNNSFLPTR